LFVAFSVSCTCKNGGRCIMGLGTYICECPYGYTGINCETSKLSLKINILRLSLNVFTVFYFWIEFFWRKISLIDVLKACNEFIFFMSIGMNNETFVERKVHENENSFPISFLN
jgi:hypothetical protein